jgi:hypothetical protein
MYLHLSGLSACLSRQCWRCRLHCMQRMSLLNSESAVSINCVSQCVFFDSLKTFSPHYFFCSIAPSLLVLILARLKVSLSAWQTLVCSSAILSLYLSMYFSVCISMYLYLLIIFQIPTNISQNIFTHIIESIFILSIYVYLSRSLQCSVFVSYRQASCHDLLLSHEVISFFFFSLHAAISCSLCLSVYLSVSFFSLPCLLVYSIISSYFQYASRLCVCMYV